MHGQQNIKTPRKILLHNLTCTRDTQDDFALLRDCKRFQC